MTNQTINGVPRPWLEDYEALADLTSGDAQKLRAMLDTPDQCRHEFESPALSSMPDYCAKCSIDKSAAQPQGEPVAYKVKYYLTESLDSANAFASNYGVPLSEIVRLYAEQPAPVAVVMPERREPKHYWDRFGKLTAIARVASEEWNAYDSELKRLNPSL